MTGRKTSAVPQRAAGSVGTRLVLCYLLKTAVICQFWCLWYHLKTIFISTKRYDIISVYAVYWRQHLCQYWCLCYLLKIAWHYWWWNPLRNCSNCSSIWLYKGINRYQIRHWATIKTIGTHCIEVNTIPNHHFHSNNTK